MSRNQHAVVAGQSAVALLGTVFLMLLALAACGDDRAPSAAEVADEHDTDVAHEGAAGRAGAGHEDRGEPQVVPHTHDLGPPPPSTATLFAEGTVNSASDEYGVSFTPGDQTVFFVRTTADFTAEHIWMAERDGDGWREPRLAPFSGRHHDKEPYVSPDGQQLFFASKRPVTVSTRPTAGAKQDFDLWVVERLGDGWSEPRHLAELSTDANEDFPALAADGTLLFAREGERGNRDLWMAQASDDGWDRPQPLGRPINTSFPEADPYIDPDGSFLIFSSPRPHQEARGQGDLWVSFRTADGGWSEPKALGPQVNTSAHEYAPALSPDGETLYFSRGFGEIWMIPIGEIGVELPR